MALYQLLLVSIFYVTILSSKIHLFIGFIQFLILYLKENIHDFIKSFKKCSFVTTEFPLRLKPRLVLFKRKHSIFTKFCFQPELPNFIPTARLSFFSFF